MTEQQQGNNNQEDDYEEEPTSGLPELSEVLPEGPQHRRPLDRVGKITNFLPKPGQFSLVELEQTDTFSMSVGLRHSRVTCQLST